MMRTMAMVLGGLMACAAVAQETPPAAPAETKNEAASQPDKQTQRPAAPRATDRLELDSTVVTGNSELPKVLYIVPWKKADLGELPDRPAGSLLDEVLAPVDREVFRRQTGYYNELSRATGGENKD